MANVRQRDRTLFGNIELLVFDKDGTLIDIHHYWSAMIRLRSRALGERYGNAQNREALEQALIEGLGVDLSTGRMKPDGPVGVKPRPYIVQVACQILAIFGAQSDEASVEKLFKAIDEETARDLAPLLRLLPGVPSLLEAARHSGVRMAIATTDKRERARRAMETLGLDYYFEMIVGGDDVQNPKPAPDCMRKIFEHTGAEPKRTIVVGDHPVDIHLGTRSGAAGSVGVTTGLSSRAVFESLPCVILDSLEEMSVEA